MWQVYIHIEVTDHLVLGILFYGWLVASPSAAFFPRPFPAAGGPLVGPSAKRARSGTIRVTVDTPSTNLVRNSTLALLNIPSFRETTMN